MRKLVSQSTGGVRAVERVKKAEFGVVVVRYSIDCGQWLLRHRRGEWESVGREKCSAPRHG